MIIFEKFGAHQPLKRHPGFELGEDRRPAAPGPWPRRIKAHVLAAERLHGDDTTRARPEDQRC